MDIFIINSNTYKQIECDIDPHKTICISLPKYEVPFDGQQGLGSTALAIDIQGNMPFHINLEINGLFFF